MVGAAKLIRRTLAGAGLLSWVKTTGGKGLHVVVPIEPAPAAACLAFARTTAETLVAHDPALFTTALPKKGREAKIFIDALRNNRTNTAVAAFSLRARAGAPVSFPLAWTQLTPRLDPAAFDLVRWPPERPPGQTPGATTGPAASGCLPREPRERGSAPGGRSPLQVTGREQGEDRQPEHDSVDDEREGRARAQVAQQPRHAQVAR